MNNRFSTSIEDYLKAIYDLTQEQERASTNEIAERMGVTPASATGFRPWKSARKASAASRGTTPRTNCGRCRT
jgi:hypothetical protein